MFTPDEITQIKTRGFNIEKIKNQIAKFQQGVPFAKIIKPAQINDGIINCSDEKIQKFTALYEETIKSKDVVKFVPASGAATRMFKSLHNVKETGNIGTKTDQDSMKYLFENIEKIAFYNDLKNIVEKNGTDFQQLINNMDYRTIAGYILDENGLGYGNYPKALILFHSYDDLIRTAIEEHLVEGAKYAKGGNNKINIHFTVQSDHQKTIDNLVHNKTPEYESKYDANYCISYSVQDPLTNTIAVDLDNKPFKLENGTILFRPAGHGALIQNLNKIDADIVIIKNIDNIVPEKFANDTYTYKKVLGGCLIETQKTVFEYLNQLKLNNISVDQIQEITDYAETTLSLIPPDKFHQFNKQQKIDYLISKFNRPIRICGMVKAEGDTGGGPFWMENSDGSVSLQVVESVQINNDCEKSVSLMKQATHFNPVDLVCSFTDINGRKFDLNKYIDNNQVFISQKSLQGRELKALELPGLWNGAMADWITLFVEVPLSTFNPVKTVNDLLKKMHQ